VWARYPFALSACGLAIIAELYLTRATGEPIRFLLAFAAVIASAAWAGPGPGLASTIVMTLWSAFDLEHSGSSLSSIFIWSFLFLGEGILLSAGSARMWRFARNAARSETWHRQLVDTAAEGIWVRDSAGVITYANSRIAGMVGLGGEDLTGRRLEEFLFPSDLSMERIRTDNLRAGMKEQFDRRLRRADGSELWVLACCNLVARGAQQTAGCLDMMTDITERKRAEAALRQSETRFRNLFEGVLEGVYQSTPDGRILAANPMLLRMLGLSSQSDLNDVNIAKDLYVDPDTRTRLLDQLEREGNLQNVEYEIRCRDGRRISVLENARVVRDDSGAVLYYEGTLIDITDRKKMEEQLRQAQKMEALARLARGIAHDFNNVLTIITGYAQLAVTELSPSHPARSSIEQVMQAAESAMALTGQLISFSKQQTQGYRRLDLNRALERCDEALRRSLEDLNSGSHQTVFLSLCPEPISVEIDQVRLEQTVIGVGKAVHETAERRGSLELKTALLYPADELRRVNPRAVSSAYAVLSAGIKEGSKILPAIPALKERFARPEFTFFQPGDHALPDLAETHAAISDLGGLLAVDRTECSDASAQNITSLHIFLPCDLPSGVPETMERSPSRSTAPAGETILLVESEPLVRELSRDMLERQGYRVILASDATEAERISDKAANFDLLITDTVTPTITGVELARKLRMSRPRLKVLFISGYSDSQSEGGHPAIAGAAFLQKPFSADSLGRKIRQILNGG
jgi:two-component system cell cycle sensor histidine kinase/response regulator CckA